jgi:hypothetical protein
VKLKAFGLPASQQRRKGTTRQGGLEGKVPMGAGKLKDPRQHDPPGPQCGGFWRQHGHPWAIRSAFTNSSMPKTLRTMGGAVVDLPAP